MSWGQLLNRGAIVAGLVATAVPMDRPCTAVLTFAVQVSTALRRVPPTSRLVYHAAQESITRKRVLHMLVIVLIVGPARTLPRLGLGARVRALAVQRASTVTHWA